MTNKKLLRLQHLLEMLLMSVTYIALMAGVYGGLLEKPKNQLWYSFFVLIPVFLAYILRKKVRNYFLFIAGNVIMAVAAYMIGNNDYESTMYCVVTLAICIHSIYLNAQFANKSRYLSNPADLAGADSIEEESIVEALSATERMSPFYALINVVAYMIAGNKGNGLLQGWEVILFIAFVVLQILYNQLQKINQVFFTNKDKSGFPAAQMIRINSLIAIILVFCMILGMAVFYYGPYGNVFTIIGGVIMAVVQLFLKIFITVLGSLTLPVSDSMEEQTQTETESTLPVLDAEVYQESHIMEALAEVFGFMLLFASIVAVVYLILRYAKRIGSARKEGFDEVEFIKTDKRDKFVRADHMKTEQEKTDKQSLKYRMLYKKKVLSGNQNKHPDATKMPSELTKENITSKDDAAEKITNTYEKARYSKEEVNQEDMNFLKNINNNKRFK